MTEYWTESLYSGITLNWYHKAGIMDISMPGYVKEAIHKFQLPTPSRPHNFPHQWNHPNYGSTAPKLSHQAPESPKLAPPESNTVQQVVSNFLYYARTVDPIILVALNSIAVNNMTAQKQTLKQSLRCSTMHPCTLKPSQYTKQAV